MLNEYIASAAGSSVLISCHSTQNRRPERRDQKETPTMELLSVKLTPLRLAVVQPEIT